MKSPNYNLSWLMFSLLAFSILFISCKKDDDKETVTQRTKLSEWSGTFTGNVESGTLSFELYSENYIGYSWQTSSTSCTNANGSYTLNGSNFTFKVSGTASSFKESSTFSMNGQGTLNSSTGDGSYSIDFDDANFSDQSGQWSASTGSSQYASVNIKISIPADAAGKTGVIIFDNDSDPSNGFVKEYVHTLSSGTNFDVILDDVPAGTYYLFGAVFVVGTYGNDPGVGDYIGVYGATSPNIPTHANAIVPASGTVTFNFDLIKWVVN